MEAKITLRLSNIPLGEAVRYTADLANMEYQVEGNVVVISPSTSSAGGDFGFEG